MKVYRANLYGPDGCSVSWHASRAAAEKHLRVAAREAGETTDETMVQLERDIGVHTIPTDRASLIAWLNRNLNTDNG